MDKTLGAYEIADLRELARRRLPKGVFEFMDRGNGDEVALVNNREAFERIKLAPHALVDTSHRSQAITLFGNRHKMPVAIAPTGSAGLNWFEGEIALARAAAAAGIPFTLATGSMTAMEKVAEQAGGTLWFQIYMWPDRSLSHRLVERAKAAGYQALVVTVDTPVPPGREYNLRNGMTVPFRFTGRNVTDVLMHPRWLATVLARYLVTSGMPRYENYPTEMKARITAAPMGRSMMVTDSLTWDDLKDLRRIWPHRLIVKGILRAEDAVLAADCGADGVIVSNHGGRAVDSTMAPIEVLPSVVEAAGKRLTVMVDSGFRRGSDVVKALALGAAAVLIGRATLYGTAVAGQAGAARAIEIYRDEIDRVLGLIGCPGVAALDHDYLIRPVAVTKRGDE
ncbi:MAG: alpha-hydroxy-acid oxidizing protein [Betaproteobacteria bacterium]|nr:alpha-hydroxy-acid oxidizing protein [Betaproteobacteria bacterium]MDH3438920.1 alpha-hydroxy-acid oxidizing protein [Betaproteobacteria bacterium]